MSSDFTMYAGDTKNIEITVTDESNVAVNLTDAEIFWQMARVIGAVPSVLSKEIGAGLTVVDAVTGRFDILLDPSDTEGLSGVYHHEVRMIDGDGKVSTILQGTVTLSSVQIDVTP